MAINLSRISNSTFAPPTFNNQATQGIRFAKAQEPTPLPSPAPMPTWNNPSQKTTGNDGATNGGLIDENGNLTGENGNPLNFVSEPLRSLNEAMSPVTDFVGTMRNGVNDAGNAISEAWNNDTVQDVATGVAIAGGFLATVLTFGMATP